MLYYLAPPQTHKYDQKGIFKPVHLAVGLSCLGWLYLTPVSAQIIPDSTLGIEQSIIDSGLDLSNSPIDLVQGGAIRGDNLFHSFLEFNIGTNQRVYFANPGSIDRIISRVTGNNASFIDGTLGVAGNADLYLFNPNGILFGPNAQLDINGSFLASTANGLDWGNGLEFNATNPQAPPLLTIDLPVSLTFAPNNTSALSSQGQLTTGADLTLAAERLELQGSVEAGGDINLLANQQVQIRDTPNQPFNAAAQGDLLIQGKSWH
ncbi:MAG: filamentous hemagglutinin N-terminal domain-containing protein [Leptolyngbya sp. SIO4C5]|nr:filamentous hemagglutinin N-terminal domain-containing protein [Leptolyngbya sp. SIO4C5]